MVDLDKDVKFVKGVGPSKVELLNKIGICSLKDLITYYPRSYEDRGNPKNICECEDKEEVLIEGIAVSKIKEMRMRGKIKSIQKLEIADETGKMEITWFNQPYLKDRFEIGKTYKFFGKVSTSYGRKTISSPIFEENEKTNNTGKIIPIYNLTYKLSQNSIRKIIENGIVEIGGNLEETLPEYLIDEYELETIDQAIRKIHFPKDFKEFECARKRLVFEELLTMQLALLELKHNYKNEMDGISFSTKVCVGDCISKLPFTLTNAQNRVIKEIEKNMESTSTMNRLVQGDVGSGKTVVAMVAAYKAVKSGYQAALMAPTAILATQHYENFVNILESLEIRCELLVSGMTKKKKEEVLERLKNRRS